MHLSHIIKNGEILSPEKPLNTEIGKPQSDFRKLAKNDVFFCEDGFHESGFTYAKHAHEKGAVAIVTALGGAKRIGAVPIPIIEVENVRKSYSLAWCRYENDPARDLRLIAVTGTNGKTSVASFLHTLLNEAGIPTGLIGTVEYTAGETHLLSSYTTPPPDILYPLLHSMKNQGVSTVVMEASSHAIAQHRLYGLQFETAVFTNLSRDHLDYHKTWEAYRDVKASLFSHAKNAVIHLGDDQAAYIGRSATGNVYYYGRKPEADFSIGNPRCNGTEISYRLGLGNEALDVRFSAVGDFHIENSAAAIACAFLEGVAPSTLARAAQRLHPPAGRMERLLLPTDFSVYIDYAHSPEALEKALRSLRSLTDKLTVIFGAGGDRDRGKRPQMGAVAEAHADFIILTDDNPRNEPSAFILDDIEQGMHKENHIRIPSRKDAILFALRQAQKGEILLLAGKGHENYTIDQNGKHTFSEKEIIKNALGSS
jgi:UDP-N-acetylmuramoyl-L-alanyl-D-glutamate--2,6-diaminopimelate ligase